MTNGWIRDLELVDCEVLEEEINWRASTEKCSAAPEKSVYCGLDTSKKQVRLYLYDTSIGNEEHIVMCEESENVLKLKVVERCWSMLMDAVHDKDEPLIQRLQAWGAQFNSVMCEGDKKYYIQGIEVAICEDKSFTDSIDDRYVYFVAQEIDFAGYGVLDGASSKYTEGEIRSLLSQAFGREKLSEMPEVYRKVYDAIVFSRGETTSVRIDLDEREILLSEMYEPNTYDYLQEDAVVASGDYLRLFNQI